jgi:hypothetical protein
VDKLRKGGEKEKEKVPAHTALYFASGPGAFISTAVICEIALLRDSDRMHRTFKISSFEQCINIPYS